jgi:epoxyqueuosine reductase
MRDTVSAFAKKHNCVWGVADAAPLDECLARAMQTPFVTKNVAKRVDPAQYLPGAKSVIAIGVPYGHERPPWPIGHAKITRMAVGRDYHAVIRNMLEELANETGLSGECYICVDSSGLMEREWALKAGLGFRGKNSMLINPVIGSFFNIGLMVTRIAADELTDYSPAGDAVQTGCGNCDLCVRSCPGGALSENGHFDYTHCVSYLTQKKGELSPDEQKIAAGSIYGCDVCQVVCPYNRFAAPQPTIDAQWIIGLDEDMFDRTLKRTCAGWRGLEILKRNARMSLTV